MAQTFTWIAGAGAWTTASNWADLTTGTSPSLVAPGPADSATITGPINLSTSYVINGPGSAATLNLTGNTALAGTFNAGTLSVVGTLAAGTINMLAGASITAGPVTLDGTLNISGPGARLAAGGTVTGPGFESLLAISNHGAFEAPGLVLDGGSIQIDATAIAEIGTAGGAAAGALTVDAGATVSDSSSEVGYPMINAAIVNNGTIVAHQLSLNGPVTGTGQLQIGASGQLTLGGSVGAGQTITFAGPTGALSLPGSAGSGATVSGFTLGDTISDTAAGVDGASFTANGSTGGTLAFTNAGTPVASLMLSGDYTTSTFRVTPVGSPMPGAPAGGVTVSVATSSPPPAAAPPGTAGPDQYTWTATSGGTWATASNWSDVTAGPGPAAVAPGAQNPVTIGNGSTLVAGTIIGDGNAASLLMFGDISLSGLFNITTVAVAPFAALDLLAGSVLATTSADVNSFLLVGGAGASLTVSGTLTIGDAAEFAGRLTVFDHGAVQAGRLVLGGAIGRATVTIAGNATFEVGNAGGATAGALTVDAGATVYGPPGVLEADINAPVVNNGTITASVLSLIGPVSGTGQIQIGGSGYLTLGGPVAAGQTITFTGAPSTLDITAAGTVAATIAGLTLRDSIVAPVDVVNAVFTPGSGGGTLALTDATGASVESLHLTGSFTGESFLAVVDPLHSRSDVVLAAGTPLAGPPPAAGPGTTEADAYTWTGFGGDWGTASNWSDVTTGASPAAVPPGANNAVTIPDVAASPGAFQIISGAGIASSLTIDGNLALSGSFGASSLVVQSSTYGVGTLDVIAGTTLTANAATVSSAAIVGGAGAIMGTAGTLTLGATGAYAPNLSVVDHGFVFAKALAYVSGGGGLLTVDATSAMEIGSTTGGAANGRLTVDAGVTVSGELFDIVAAVTNNGTIVASGNSLGGGPGIASIDGDIAGTGELQIGANAALELGGTIGAGQAVAFAGNAATLDLTGIFARTGSTVPGGASVAGTISGFVAGDEIKLPGTINGASYAASGGGPGTLTLTNNGTTVSTLTLAGDFTGNTFLTNPDANGTDLTLASGVPCFAAGTRIDTPSGAVPVEALRAGDSVLTHRGDSLPVVWLGHRRIDCRRHPRPRDVWPVRVRAGAFGDRLPVRDLMLSPDHAVFIYGALIPIRYLVNGATVLQQRVAQVTYYHIELPAHEVILAEGLPVESYLDLGNRNAFDNGGGALVLHPDFASQVWERDACAELIFGGPVLAAVKQRLLLQAGWLGHATTDDPDLRLQVGRSVLYPDRVGLGYRFSLPAGVRTARLLSRVHVPAHMRAGSDDGRVLGVGVAELLLDRQAMGLADARLGAGWHAADRDAGMRWTDGDARIGVHGASELVVRVEATGRYWAGLAQQVVSPAGPPGSRRLRSSP